MECALRSRPDGLDRTDRTRLALWFLPEGEDPEHELIRSHMADNEDLDLPGGEERIRTDGYEYLDKYPDNRIQPICITWELGSVLRLSIRITGADFKLCRLGFWLAHCL